MGESLTICNDVTRQMPAALCGEPEEQQLNNAPVYVIWSVHTSCVMLCSK